MTDRIQENDTVVLLEDIPERRLYRGAIGTVVDSVPPSRTDSAYLLVEFENGVQADFDDTQDILKLHSRPRSKRPTLQEWAGASKIFALVFTDIVDSTTLANELHDEKWIEVLLTHFAQARSLMAKYDHHEIKLIGDSFMVVFRDVLDALDFALALQADTGDDRIRIRAGIHLGPARIIEDDIFGIMVNYTKRVESTENPVGIRLSDEAKRHVTDEGAQRHSLLSFDPNEVTFKGFPDIQTTWSVLQHPLVLIARRDRTRGNLI